MATWSENGRALGFASCVCVFALACTLNPLAGDPSATAAGVPPSMAQGFAEIVKKVTPAVVNIAVTGGNEGGRGRRPLPPGPFGGPPGGPPGVEGQLQASAAGSGGTSGCTVPTVAFHAAE